MYNSDNGFWNYNRPGYLELKHQEIFNQTVRSAGGDFIIDGLDKLDEIDDILSAALGGLQNRKTFNADNRLSDYIADADYEQEQLKSVLTSLED